MYNYNHLFYFYKVVVFKGLTAASQNLKISQPSLTSQIKTLESNLGFKLFFRKGRKNELTSFGNNLFLICSEIFEKAVDINHLINIKKKTEKAIYIVGLSNSLGQNYFLNLIHEIINSPVLSSNSKIRIVVDSQDNLVLKLNNNEIDLFISSETIHYSNLILLLKIESPVYLFASKKWINQTLNNKHNTKLFHSLPLWIFPHQNHYFRNEINTFIKSIPSKFEIAFEGDSIQSIIDSTQIGLGISFLPLIYINKKSDKNILFPIGSKLWNYSIWFYTQNKNLNKILTDKIMDIIISKIKI